MSGSSGEADVFTCGLWSEPERRTATATSFSSGIGWDIIRV